MIPVASATFGQCFDDPAIADAVPVAAFDHTLQFRFEQLEPLDLVTHGSQLLTRYLICPVAWRLRIARQCNELPDCFNRHTKIACVENEKQPFMV